MAGLVFDTQVYRPAGYIRTSIDNTGKALLLALILVAVALLLAAAKRVRSSPRSMCATTSRERTPPHHGSVTLTVLLRSTRPVL